jgi:hypothetical protein
MACFLLYAYYMSTIGYGWRDEEKIPLGIIYKKEKGGCFHGRLGVLKDRISG